MIESIIAYGIGGIVLVVIINALSVGFMFGVDRVLSYDHDSKKDMDDMPRGRAWYDEEQDDSEQDTDHHK